MNNELYFAEPFTKFQAWIDLLLLCNHSETKFFPRGVEVVVQRGQCARSIEHLATRWQWSKGKIMRFISYLEDSGQIVTQKSNVTTLISIVNYEKYQVDGNAEDNADSNADRYAYKNEKNEKNVVLNTKRKKKNLDCAALPIGFTPEYIALWEKYREYRKRERKGWFKSAATETRAMEKFLEESGGDANVAAAMLDKSIVNTWTGLFPIKNFNNGQQTTTNNKQSGRTTTGDTIASIAKITDF